MHTAPITPPSTGRGAAVRARIPANAHADTTSATAPVTRTPSSAIAAGDTRL